MDLFHLAIPPWELVLRSVVTYGALLLALRLFGKREVGQFTLYDLVLILLVANALQPSMTGPDTSLLGGMIIIVTLVTLNFIVGRLDAFAWFHQLFGDQPTTIVEGGRYLDKPMDSQGVTKQEVDSAIREHGLKSVGEVDLGVLEPDGSISIIGKDERARARRRRRYKRRV